MVTAPVASETQYSVTASRDLRSNVSSSDESRMSLGVPSAMAFIVLTNSASMPLSSAQEGGRERQRERERERERGREGGREGEREGERERERERGGNEKG